MPSFLFWSAEERLKRPLLDLATFGYTSNRSAVLRLACVQLNGAGGGHLNGAGGGHRFRVSNFQRGSCCLKFSLLKICRSHEVRLPLPEGPANDRRFSP
jgi:hypothetical protein